MKFDIDIHIHTPLPDDAQAAILNLIRTTDRILRNTEKIMATQVEDAARVVVLGGKLDKISVETTSLVEAVRALQTTAGQSDPALTAAIDAVLGKADAIDALVDDIAPNPTPTPDPIP